MADLVLTVEAQGTAQAAAGIDRVGHSVTRTGQSWEMLKRKMGSGEVMRNAAATSVLLSVGSDRAAQKVAALASAFSAIPGAVGATASAIAVAATVYDLIEQRAEAAKAAIAALAAEIAHMGQMKINTQLQLADRIGGAADKLGPAGRAMAMTDGAIDHYDSFARMTGDPKTAAIMSTQMAEAKLSDIETKRTMDGLKLAVAAGAELNTAALNTVMMAAKEQTIAFGGADVGANLSAKAASIDAADARGMSGLGFGFARRNVAAQARSRDIAMEVSGESESASRRIDNAQRPLHKLISDAFDKAGAPAGAEAASAWGDVMAASSREGGEALRVATDKASGSTMILTKAIVDLTSAIKNKEGKNTVIGTEPASADKAFTEATSFGREFARMRNEQ